MRVRRRQPGATDRTEAKPTEGLSCALPPLFDPPSNELTQRLRPVSWLADITLDRLPDTASRRSVTSLIEDDPPTVAGAAAAWAISRLTAFPFHLSRGTERRTHASMIHAIAQARRG